MPTNAKRSLHETITRRRNAAIGYAALDAILVAAVTTVSVTSHNLWTLLPAVILVPAITLNVIMAVRAQLALRIYRGNPIAAYIAEMSNAFGDGKSDCVCED